MTTKTDLRRQLKQARLKLPGQERQARSQLINQRLLEIVDWPNVRTMHYYEPLIALGEVDISGFMTALGKAHPGIEMFTTRKFDDSWQVVPIDAESSEAAPEFDVIIVPMLGFDPATLHRLGYGGGYYDKFLATQPRARKIGVCFEANWVMQLPAEPHDIAMDAIITDRVTRQRPSLT